jgi:hypothetical protein
VIVLPVEKGATLQPVRLVFVLEGLQLVREAASLSRLHLKIQRSVVQAVQKLVVRKWVVAEVDQRAAPLVARGLDESVVEERARAT